MRAALIGVTVALVACSAPPVEHHVPSPPPAERPAPTGPSIYELGLALTDATGHSIALDVDRGQPTLISMFYGSCAAACPALIDAVDRMVAQMPPDVHVLLVSFDPARDTPARLRELVATHHLDARWTLSAASATDARTLAAVLGIRYRALASGEFFHTSAIVALDRDGRPVARMDGLGDPSALVAAAQRL